MTLKQTLRDLHRAICETPDDLDLRSVYADCLEESGEVDRAEFIRVQIAGGLATVRLTWLIPFEAFFGCQPHQTTRAGSLGQAQVWTRDGKRLIWYNGFPDHITCTCAAWLAHGPAIVLATPVREVVLSDREPRELPSNVAKRFAWYNVGMLPVGSFTLSPELFEAIWGTSGGEIDFAHTRGFVEEGLGAIRFDTHAAALTALSTACIAWARREAGLPG